MLSLVVWASLFPPIPLFAAALFVDTPQTLLLALKGINGFTIFVIFYQAVFANIFGFGIWSRLIAKYSASVVAPLSLLTPVTGLLTALLILKEKMSLMQYVAGILIVSGVFITNIRMKDFKKLKDPILK